MHSNRTVFIKKPNTTSINGISSKNSWSITKHNHTKLEIHKKDTVISKRRRYINIVFMVSVYTEQSKEMFKLYTNNT